jgi:hypothetical protein
MLLSMGANSVDEEKWLLELHQKRLEEGLED